MKSKLIIFLSLSFTLYTFAQPKQFRRADGQKIDSRYVDSVARKLLDTAQLTGLQLSIINDNKIVFANSYGYRNKAKNQLNDTSTCFYAASLAKPLFAYIVMQLVDEEKIDLDKPLYLYLPKPLPEYENYIDLKGDDRWKLITARDCLDHTTGFPNWREYNPHDNKKLEIFFTPGTRYAYSGEGIYLLQMVIETITKRHLEDIAREKIFKPFSMGRTSFLWQRTFESDYAAGHDMNGDTLSKYRSKKENAAGSMETTIADYSRFIAMVMQGERLSAKSYQEMFKPQIGINSVREFPSLDTSTTTENKNVQLSYGLGWGLFTSSAGKAFFKEGHGDGWVHYVIGFPDKKTALVIMCNDANGESIFKELVEKVAGVTIPWYWEGYTPYRKNIKLPVAELKQFTGVYDGKLKAIVTLVNDRLQVESPAVNLPKTNLYASGKNHFFLKIMDTDIEFITGPDGKIVKAVLNDEGEHYELIKVK